LKETRSRRIGVGPSRWLYRNVDSGLLSGIAPLWLEEVGVTGAAFGNLRPSMGFRVIADDSAVRNRASERRIADAIASCWRTAGIKPAMVYPPWIISAAAHRTLIAAMKACDK